MNKVKKSVLGLLSLSFTLMNVYSQILHVPAKYNTIQSAIEAAKKGDTVLVAPGIYFENINFRGKSIVVASKYLITKDTSYISTTIIDGSKPIYPDSASCALLISAEDSGAVLQGLTLTKGKGTPIKGYVEGGGVLLNNSNARIMNNIIIDNSVKAGGGGIASWNGNPSILNNLIVNNYAEYAAGVVLNWSNGTIKNNIIYHNIKTGTRWLTGGLMIWDTPGNPVIENNTIVGNYSSTNSGGISVTSISNPIIVNNIIWGNRQLSGIQISGTKPKMVTYCNTEDIIAGEGNIQSFPLFNPDTFNLAPGCASIDAGNSNPGYNDKEDSLIQGKAMKPSTGAVRNDLGAFGGAGATELNRFHIEDIYISKKIIAFGEADIAVTKNISLEVLNLGTGIVTIDSITIKNSSLIITGIASNRKLCIFDNDTLNIEWKPVKEGPLNDTLKIYHSYKNFANPISIAIIGNANAIKTSVENSFEETEILCVVPNPCSNNCKIKYQVKNESQVVLDLFNINGEKVDKLICTKKRAGNYELQYNNSKLKSGLYILSFQSGGKTINRKILIN